ncbi:MAG: AMP-binding protein, partial [Ignavibacteriales bacterium]|nr:AMP-binding protein [Ignavibacteriales bacterium]
MHTDFFIEVFKENPNDDAIVWRDRRFSYEWLLARIEHWTKEIERQALEHGSVVAIEADFSPNAVALFFALIEFDATIVPLTKAVEKHKEKFLEIAECEWLVEIDEKDEGTFRKLDRRATHEYFQTLRERKHPGVVVFSSGTTGKHKASVHDLVPLLEKFRVRRHKRRAVTFLLYDHLGGVNTMLYILSNGGCVVTVQDRDPDSVLAAVEKFEVDMLPTSPTFINLMIFGEAYKRHDLRSLKLVTYGTEPMPESTLKRFTELFPDIKLQQTYGLSETGVMRSKSKSSDSLWVKVGGEGYEWRVVEGILQIKSKSAMLGYLNAPSPFTDDGWLVTGDQVEVDGEWLKILGRKSEMINVGGQKLYPAEVESVVQEMDNVVEVTVYGEKNPITGSMVCATVRLREDEEKKAFTKR